MPQKPGAVYFFLSQIYPHKLKMKLKKIFSVLSALFFGYCPTCEQGKILNGLWTIQKKCPHCGYQVTGGESGYFLGSLVISYLLSAVLTIPVVIFLKFQNAPIEILLGVPFLEYAILAPLLVRYARVAWVYGEYYLTKGWDQRR